MAVLTIRDLDDALYRRLEDRARRHHRSVEAEAAVILRETLMHDREAVIREIDAIRRSLESKVSGDVVAEIRADRDAR